MEVLIDIMSEEDLDRVMDIEEAVFSDSWSRESFLNEINNNPNSLYLTARKGRDIAGYIGGWILTSELHITNLAVDCKYREKGIATRLLEELLRQALIQGIKYSTLEVRASNKRAINLYKKFGFKIMGIKPEYYRNNQEDALVMWKEFNNDR